MDINLLFSTIRFLKPTQILWQLKNRLIHPKYYQFSTPVHQTCELLESPIPRNICFRNEIFTFLNITQAFDGWNNDANGNLYTYNINYFDYINSGALLKEDACKWIDQFITEVENVSLGLDPYPIALRSINWIKFFSQHPDCINENRDSALWSQLCLLEKKLEYHLLGNHLLEDAFSLFIASIYFNDERMYHRYSKLLGSELREQILCDGAHYEQSPMYHCILLDRLLDCCNFSFSNPRFENQNLMNDCLKHYASLMLGHLDSIIYANGDIPLLNDSANAIAPTTYQLFDYAGRLGIEWERKPLYECGYRHWRINDKEVIIDIGNITASYQPGHTHADTFNYEMRISGKPFIVDTGISTYEKNSRRQYERSTVAHNTVSVGNCNSSEVWGGFRVGKRANVEVYIDSDNHISASHNGFVGIRCKRDFVNDQRGFVVTETLSKHVKAESFIHLGPDVQIKEASKDKVLTSLGVIEVYNAERLEVVDEFVSTEYNKLTPIKKIIISFTENMQYIIK